MKKSKPLHDKHDYILLGFNGKEVEIDKGIADLMKYIWKKGIKTHYCCEGSSIEEPYIMFNTSEDATKFGKEMIELCGFNADRVWHWSRFHGTCWKWEAKYNYDLDHIRITCRFPMEDLTEMSERVKNEG